jgi:FO synthase
MSDYRELKRILADAEDGLPPDDALALTLAECADVAALTRTAERIALSGHGARITYSKKIFIPLTHLCRDVCHYCTFAEAPHDSRPPYMPREAVLDLARRGAAMGCKEALFTLGDKPELRYAAARRALDALGHESTLSYLEEMAGLVLRETGLLPHLNPGLMDEPWLLRLKKVSASQGIMLETASPRLSERGGPHFGSPDKLPAARLATLEAAGRAQVAFTTGLLIGIGETRAERIEALLAIRDLHRRYGHIQEIIVQNFRAKPRTRMASAPEPTLAEHVWTIAVARILFGSAMTIQAPPNLQPEGLMQLVRAGIDDWGGVSPLTPDHVNPERPWPHLSDLEAATEAAERRLADRLAIYPAFAADADRWLAKELHTPVLRLQDGAGLGREDDWCPGTTQALPERWISRLQGAPTRPSQPVAAVLDALEAGRVASEADIVTLFDARGSDFDSVCAAADALRARRNGDVVSYVVNRNINYTNICTYGCKFCAFSKGRHNLGHRDKPYDLTLAEIADRTLEAWEKGATEVCLQGGIRPGYTGETYLAVTRAVKDAVANMHVHAFSPLEVWHGATSLGLPLREFLSRLKDAGLGSLPGTAAEILDDEVRAVLCPDKINTAQWFEVMRTAHSLGIRTTATIMFGHVDGYRHWARHLLRIRGLQEETGGFTEFVPLPYVHMEAPMYQRGRSRKGPTFRESVLMHAIARLVLDPLITNIQASWVKMGPGGAAVCLAAGSNDMGGVLMNESITRAAGAAHGQEQTAPELEALIRAAQRVPRQRTTTYEPVLQAPRSAAYIAAE